MGLISRVSSRTYRRQLLNTEICISVILNSIMDKYAGHFSSNTTNLNRSDTMSTTRQSQYVCDIRDLGSTDDVRISRVREKSDKIRNLTQQLYGCDIGSKNVMPPSPNMISTDKRVSGVQIQRQETQNYGQVCQVDGNCGLTVPITEKLCENVEKIVKIKFFLNIFYSLSFEPSNKPSKNRASKKNGK